MESLLPLVGIRRICFEVCKEYDILLTELQGRGRSQHLTRARRTFCERARLAGYSMPRIGKYLHRDHTTVLHHLHKAGIW